MSRILFACYHPLERATVSPIAARLRSQGHLSAFLGLFSEKTEISRENGPTFVFRDPRPESLSREASVDLIGQLIPKSLDNKRQIRLCKTIRSLYPSLDTVFPLRISDWQPQWTEFVESVFSQWQPDLVVLSLGQLETVIVRSLCGRLRISCLYLLTPFYEFKDVERLPISLASGRNDEFCVATEVGMQKLTQQHVPAKNISVTGAPQFDYLNEIRQVSNRPSDLCILMADQQHPEGHRLLDLLLRYVRDHPGSHLRIRPHPSASETVRQDWERLISSRDQHQAVNLSPPESNVTDDLAMSSVVTSVSSMLMVEARLMGIPAICWNPGLLPPEIAIDSRGRIPIARCYSQLRDLLDRVSQSTSRESNERVGIAGDLVAESAATTRVCNRILNRLKR